MDCSEASTLFLDHRRKRLDSDVATVLESHLERCDRCRQEAGEDAALSDALQRLPSRPMPESLRRSLESRWTPSRRPPAHAGRRGRVALAIAAVCAVGAMAAAGFVFRKRTTSDVMYVEAINDHLRVLYSEHPVEVQSSDSHQVKPWFSGRVDFAPVVAFDGDADFPLQGGAVAYFIDRKAVAYEYKRHLHLITLFVFRADGLSWPVPSRQIGRAHGTVETQRGFHVVLWQNNDLGYALVSDLNERELTTLAGKIAGAP